MANEQHPGPWVWDSICGEWGLWDAAGEPLIMEYTFSDPSESARLDPYVEAVTAAAPEMLELLRKVTDEYEALVRSDYQGSHGQRFLQTPEITEARTLLARIDGVSK